MIEAVPNGKSLTLRSGDGATMVMIRRIPLSLGNKSYKHPDFHVVISAPDVLEVMAVENCAKLDGFFQQLRVYCNVGMTERLPFHSAGRKPRGYRWMLIEALPAGEVLGLRIAIQPGKKTPDAQSIVVEVTMPTTEINRLVDEAVGLMKEANQVIRASSLDSYNDLYAVTAPVGESDWTEIYFNEKGMKALGRWNYDNLSSAALKIPGVFQTDSTESGHLRLALDVDPTDREALSTALAPVHAWLQGLLKPAQ